MRALSVSPLWLLAIVLVESREPATRAEAADSIFPVPPRSGPVRRFTTDMTTADDGFYIVDSVSTDFDSAFSIPSPVSHSLSVKSESDTSESIVHDPRYPFSQKRVNFPQSERMDYRVPSNRIDASSLPGELSVTSVTPDVAAETSVKFTLHPQSMEPHVSHLGTPASSSVEAAPSSLPDFPPPPPVASVSPAPDVPPSMTAKHKAPRGTYTTTTTTTTSQRSKKDYLFETGEGSNAATDSSTTATATSSAELLFKKFSPFTTRSSTGTPSVKTSTSTTSTATTTTTTAATTSPPPPLTGPSGTGEEHGDTPAGGIPDATRTISTTTTALPNVRSRRRVCALFQFVLNQILKLVSRCQEPGGDEGGSEQMQVKNGVPTAADGIVNQHEDEMDFMLESLTDRFLMWADSLLQWLGALGRLMQSDSDSLHDVFLKVPTERVS